MKRDCAVPPLVYYMHENQLTYPFSSGENRKEEDFHYGFINIRSAVSADYTVFNSQYHKTQFLTAARDLFRRLPDYANLSWIERLEESSEVLPVGFHFNELYEIGNSSVSRWHPTLLWNHRWDDDKNPALFYELCTFLVEKKVNFKLILIGESKNRKSNFFNLISSEFEKNIIHAGYVEGIEDYRKLIAKATILPVTSHHDFYGLSVLEAIAAGVTPLLPLGKVYSDFLPNTTFEAQYYARPDDLFRKTLSNSLSPFIRFDSLILKDQNISNIVAVFDLYIDNLFNV